MDLVATHLVLLAAFLGSWLLVGGSVYQAAIELDEQDVDRDGLSDAKEAVPHPAAMSPWWWLLPPVAFVRQQRLSRQYREAVLGSLTPDQVQQWVHFSEKAVGWALVGTGGALLALKETWELVHELDRTAAYWPLVAGAALLCAANTVLRRRRNRHRIATAQARQHHRAA